MSSGNSSRNPSPAPQAGADQAEGGPSFSRHTAARCSASAAVTPNPQSPPPNSATAGRNLTVTSDKVNLLVHAFF